MLHIIGQNIITAMQIRPRFRERHQAQRGAGAQTTLKMGGVSCFNNQAIQIIQYIIRNAHALGFGAFFFDVDVQRGNWRASSRFERTRQHAFFGLFVGIAQGHLNQKTIKLGFWQRIGAHLLGWILRCHHPERLWEVVPLAIDADAAFFHRFQQRALAFARRTV